MDSALSDPHNGSAEAGGAANGTTRPPSTPEGIALAYGSLLLMALLPIFFGALRSVRCARGKNASDMPETITSRDAARFPIIASCTLLGLYLFFKVYFPNKSYTGSVLKTWKTQKSKKGKTAVIQNPTTRDNHRFPLEIFSQEYINLLLSVYFFVLGILALSHTISPFMNKFFPANFPNRQYQLLFTQGSGENKEGGRGSPAPGSGLTRPLCPEIINYEFDAKDLVCLGLSSIVGVWYLLRKHWIANNLFGLAFSLNGVELLHLNNVSTGCILLGGLFIYDVFWVFGTNVMVTVAKSFEAPIKLVFPQDLLEKGLEADNFAMLGLGDIVIPACPSVPGPRLHRLSCPGGTGQGGSDRDVQLRVLGGNPASHPEAHPLPHSLGLPSQPGRLHATEASWPSPPAPAESQRHVMPGGCPPARFPPTAPGPKL
ncbi:minor histocompatibility antigen H13 isoform X10 [Mirounga angustirostris]|uniref:minor histocompatibility antigen H13 isoform X10 n=2 Tax=Mirounga angustirostris TaxID=9716 RepID=UPI00313B3D76